jgi:predicted aspartyl protease
MAIVEFQKFDGKWQEFHLKIDTGAIITAMNPGDCELLGFNLTDGEEADLTTANNSKLKVFVHNIKLKIGNDILPSTVRVAFAATQISELLLGRLDIFNFFDITLQQRTMQITFLFNRI